MGLNSPKCIQPCLFWTLCTGSQSCGNRIRALPKLFSKLVLTWCIVLYVYVLLIYATYNSTADLLGQDTLVKEIKSQEFIFSWLNKNLFFQKLLQSLLVVCFMQLSSMLGTVLDVRLAGCRLHGNPCHEAPRAMAHSL